MTGSDADQQSKAGNTQPSRLALYVPTLSGGGAEHTTLRLAGEFAARGYAVDLVVNRKAGALAGSIPPGLRVFELSPRPKWRGRLAALRAYPGDFRQLLLPVLLTRKPIMTLRYLPALADYLRTEKPQTMLSALFYANLLAIWARRLAYADTRIIVSQRNTLSRRIAEGGERLGGKWRWRYLPGLIARCYPRAEGIVSISNGVGDDLAATANLDRTSITTIYNPVVSDKLMQKAREPVDHPWLKNTEIPVILAVGRLEPQKDFTTLLEAFSIVRTQRPARLIILGEGNCRQVLTEQAQSLGIDKDVQLPGWVDNPYAYMYNASVFVSSSIWEGLGNVIIEAMACGCPVVATDCPSGPREILANGQYGRLVPVGQADSLAQALRQTLSQPREADALIARAGCFSIDINANRYLARIRTASAKEN